jgi:hypothetical protein
MWMDNVELGLRNMGVQRREQELWTEQMSCDGGQNQTQKACAKEELIY